MTLTDCFVRFKCPTKSRMKTTWRIEAKKTHMVNHVIKICDVILGPHNVRNGSYKHITDVLQVLNRSHKHIIDVLQVLNRSHKHITTSQPMGLFCKFVPIEVRNASPLFCESSKKSQTHHHKSTSEDVLQVLNRSHKHITDVLQVLNRSHKHIIDVLQVLNRSHKHITTSQPMRMYYKFLKNAVRNTSPLFCKSSTEVTNTSPKVDQ